MPMNETGVCRTTAFGWKVKLRRLFLILPLKLCYGVFFSFFSSFPFLPLPSLPFPPSLQAYLNCCTLSWNQKSWIPWTLTSSIYLSGAQLPSSQNKGTGLDERLHPSSFNIYYQLTGFVCLEFSYSNDFKKSSFQEWTRLRNSGLQLVIATGQEDSQHKRTKLAKEWPPLPEFKVK